MGLQTILIKAEDLTRNTLIGGNLDVDRYLQAIKACQNIYIKPLLGKELYDKIVLLYENDNLTGLYLELYESYVQELIIHGSAEIYLAQGAYMVSNNGITKTKTDTSETVDKNEIDFLVQASRKLYNLYETEFLKWIKTVTIPEYPLNTTLKGKTYGNWFLKNRGC